MKKVGKPPKYCYELAIALLHVTIGGWLVKAYWCTEEEIRKVAGLDSVVFLRLFTFRFSVCVAFDQ
jgi:hypothetical protein